MKHSKSDISGETSGIRARTLPLLLREGRWRLEEFRGRAESSFLWITRGQGRLTIGTVTRNFGPHTIVYIPARTFHSVHLANTVKGYAIHATETLPVPVPAFPAMIRATAITEQGQITSYAEQLQNEAAISKPGAEQAAESWLTLLSVWIERNRDRDEWRPAPRSKGILLVERFLRLIEAEFASGRSLADCAADLGVTPTHLTRLCRKTFGKGAHEMLRDRVFLEAWLLLRDTDLRISDIADRLGFASSAYFIRQFHARTGMSPGDFRIAPTGESLLFSGAPARPIRQT